MDPFLNETRAITRRHFFGQCQVGVGAAALAAMLARDARAADPAKPQAIPAAIPGTVNPMLPRKSHFNGKAKSIIYLHMAGSPPQQELFDYKPKLIELNDKDCPPEFIKGERFAFIKGHPQLLGSPWKFAHHGKSGQHISELLPNIASCADDIAIIKSMYTDQFNHAPAQLFLYTGHTQFGHPSMGSWLTYGLGTQNQDLPGFVVLVSVKTPDAGKSAWGSGFLPSVFQGVQCRSAGEPVLYVNNPGGMDRDGRRRSLDAMRDLNTIQHEQFADPETLTRIAQYELAYRMQISVPDVMDISKEKKETLDDYGAVPGSGSFANNCVLARRLVERGVRYVQLFDWGWDIHGTNPGDDIMNALPNKCKATDKPIAALIKDLKQRGLLDQTIIVWSGEFGRTPMNEKRGGSKFLGRDHHPHAMSMWLAGGGIKGGVTHGSTDELGYFAAENKVHVHDIQATMLHLMGLDHKKLTFKFQGLDQRLTSVTRESEVVKGILA